MPYYVYILRSTSNKLYIGQTNSLDKRTHQHLTKDKKAAKYTKDNDEFKLVYQEEYATRLEVMRREKQLKGWSKSKKEALIKGDSVKLKKLSKSRALLNSGG